MSKQFVPFWKRQKASIQEPSPHHTVLCLNCGYLYQRKGRAHSKACPHCGTKYETVRETEFYVGKNRIHTGKDMERQRERIDKEDNKVIRQ